jgi:hypothetical protein
MTIIVRHMIAVDGRTEAFKEEVTKSNKLRDKVDVDRSSIGF